MPPVDVLPAGLPTERAVVRTFHPRRGRLSGRHLDALHRLWPVWGTPSFPDGPLDAQRLFGRSVPLVVEIGSGMGDATAAMAAADPGRGYLAVEVHTPGVANLLALVEEAGLPNVRVAGDDALELLRERFAEASVDAFHIFFPDPWPKSRHHKRRLIQAAHAGLLAARLAPGGTLLAATDNAGYAEAMLETLAAEPRLVNAHDGFAPRPGARPLTKFEQRAIGAGRRIYDLEFVRS